MSRPDLPARLASIQAAAEKALAARAQAPCDHQHGTVEMVRILVTGDKRIYRGCVDCEQPTEGGQWLSHDGREIDALHVAVDERTLRPPCARCGRFGTEIHHFAPRALFGNEEAGLWPTAYLCNPCHTYWHTVMREAPW